MKELVEESCTCLPSNLLRDRVALVTGGSRGIGRATALRLAEAGAHVVVNYVAHDRHADEVVFAARERGVEAFAVRADVANSADAEVLVEAAVERFGRLDLLIANAGVWEGAPAAKMSDEVWDRVLDINLRGTWTACRAAIPALRQQERSSIVIVSSTAGQRGEAGYSNYAASKGGQISFAKSLAVELAPRIRVNCVAPGWVDTELNDPVFASSFSSPAPRGGSSKGNGQKSEYRLEVEQGIPLRRLATADDVATAIVFLASNWARHITGEVLNINGGSVLCG